jgi:DNA-binding Xre family transcriptional regulator
VIGNNIEELLRIRQGKKDGEKVNVSQFQLEMGISYTAASDLVKNKTKMISFEMLNDLCAYLGVGPGEIFPYKPDRKVAVE